MGPDRKRTFDCLPMKITALSSCLAVFGLMSEDHTSLDERWQVILVSHGFKERDQLIDAVRWRRAFQAMPSPPTTNSRGNQML